MPDPLPVDIAPGATPREPSCHVCNHAHHVLGCDWCLCAGDIAPGI